ncbi:glycerate kinase [Alicyclobacillus vulcanalis]|nr:glycerate kinase [Alicyclobacillus vulcanalis]
MARNAVRLLVAPDSFKGSLTADEAARAMAEGARRACPSAHVTLLPVADGGEGTLDAIAASTGARAVWVEVTSSGGHRKKAYFLALPDGTAVIECAQAVGLPEAMASGQDVWHRATWGVGEMIRHALDLGHRRIAVTLGGSGTNDAGLGMLSALGVQLVDDAGEPVPPVPAAMHRIARADVAGLDARLRGVELLAVCDVENPLCGPQGATRVFGPQKGVDAADVERLDGEIARVAEICERAMGRLAASLAGAGAAGGLGFALYLLGARRLSGIDFVLDATQFDEHVRSADLVLTGEGRTDEQTAYGKAVAGVARRAQSHGVPVFCISGSIGPGAEALYDQGVTALFSITPGPMDLGEALANAPLLLRSAVENAMRAWRAGREGWVRSNE